LLLFWSFFSSFLKRDSSSLLLLYILTAPAGNLLGLFKTGLKTQFSALAQLKRITSALFSASQLFNPESHVTSNYEYDFHVPLGPKFHPSKSSHSAARERVKSSDLQALRVLWERSNCPSLNSLSARHLFPSCLLLLTPCTPPSFPSLSESLGWQEREKISPFLILNISGIDSFCTCGGRGRTKTLHELILGNEKLNHPIKRCLLSSPGTALP